MASAPHLGPGDARPRPGSPTSGRNLGAALLGLGLLYVATDHGRAPEFGPWTRGQLAACAVLLAALGLWLASYRLSLPRRVEALRRGVAVAGSAALGTLCALELGLRWADEAPYRGREDRGRHAPDPVCGHVFAPNWSGVLEQREFRVPWRSNAQGIRADRDVGPKRQGVLRVLAVGDSFTAGDQVPLAATWPGVLESELERALGSDRVEVWNAGFPGYGTELEARWIETRAAGFEPDLVLLALTPNDLGENEDPLRTTALDGALVRADRGAWAAARHAHRSRWWCLAGHVERSALVRVLDPLGRYRRLRWGRGEVPHANAYRPPADPRAERQWALAEAALERARDASGDLGAHFAGLVLPFRAQLGELEGGLDPGHFGAHWEAFGRRTGFPVLDLLPAFRSHPEPRSLFWREDGHCTAAGYRLVGERAAAFLLERAAELGLAP